MRLEMDQTKPEREPNVEGHQRELDVQESSETAFGKVRPRYVPEGADE